MPEVSTNFGHLLSAQKIITFVLYSRNLIRALDGQVSGNLSNQKKMAMKVFIMKKMPSLEWSEWKFCAQNVMPTLAMFLTTAHLQQGNDIV